MTTADMITKLLAEGGFDVSRAQALSWLNELHKQAVAQALWRKAVTTTLTVNGQDSYVLPANVVALEELDVGGTPYERIGYKDMLDLALGWRLLVGPGGVYCPMYDSSGTQQFKLYPSPNADGTVITTLVALQADDLTDDTSTPIIPPDLHIDLLGGATAWGMKTMDEDFFGSLLRQQEFQDLVSQLSRRVNARIGSDRPSQIQVAGYHW